MDRSPSESAGTGKASLRSYAVGFILAIVLTAFAFALAMSGKASRPVALSGIFVAAALQILVHLHYFLHLDMSSSARWNLLALLFTLLIMVIFIGGSIWIMFDLNFRMM